MFPQLDETSTVFDELTVQNRKITELEKRTKFGKNLEKLNNATKSGFFFDDGGVRFCLFLRNIQLTEKQLNRIMTISGVESCGSSCFQDCSVVFYLDSISELTPQRVAQAKSEIREILGDFENDEFER